MMRSDDNSSKTDNFSFPMFVFHQTVTSTLPIFSVKRSSAILRVDVVGLTRDFIGCTAECLTTLTKTPDSTFALTTPIPEIVTSMFGRSVGTLLRQRIYCRDWPYSYPRFRPCRFPSGYPFFPIESSTVDGPFYHIDNNGAAHLVELPIVEISDR